jgi:hypothetical protein
MGYRFSNGGYPLGVNPIAGHKWLKVNEQVKNGGRIEVGREAWWHGRNQGKHRG